MADPRQSNISDSPLALAERLELMVPGFRGYKERDLIRQDDALVRKAIGDILLKVQEKIKIAEAKLADANPFNANIHPIEMLLSKVRTVTEEVSSAPAGALSFYARFKFTLVEQRALVNFDLSLFDLSNKLLASITGDLDVPALTEQVNAIHEKFYERNKIFYPQSLK
jgi:hypothetical protein